MASNELDPNFVTEINGKPVDVSGSFYLYVDTESFQGPIHIEKVFGIVSKETNIVLKFRLIASDIAWKGTGYCILLPIWHLLQNCTLKVNLSEVYGAFLT